MKMCVGGTFDPFHKGHRALLSKAFEIGSHVLIGISSDDFASEGRRRRVRNFDERASAVRSWISANYPEKRFEIVPISDRYGPAVKEDFDAIVVSPETEKTAEEINSIRLKKGLKPLKIVRIGFVLAEDLLPVSATRIRAGEIDQEGKRLKPVRINLGSTNAVKLDAVQHVFREIFRNIEVNGVEAGGGVPAQPFGDETIKGAENRARGAICDGDYGIGIEAGLIWNEYAKQYFDIQYCAVIDRFGYMTFGHGSGFYYPPQVINEVIKGKGNITISDAMHKVTGIRDIGKKQGAIGFLSKGLLTRTRLTEQAIIMAMVPRISGELYL